MTDSKVQGHEIKPGDVLIFSRDGVLITEIDGNLSYVGTADGRGYGPRDIDDTLSRMSAKARERLAAAQRRRKTEAKTAAPRISFRGVEPADEATVISELTDWYLDGSQIVSDRTALRIVIDWAEAGFIDAQTADRVRHGYPINAGDFLQTTLTAYAESLRYVDALQPDLHGFKRYGLVALAAWIAKHSPGHNA
jgi:hypothetical protein